MKLIQGDCLEVLKTLSDNSVDAVVTDPPYGLKFMGKKWDYDVPSVDVWREIMRVLKHGGHALVACGTRTQHRMALNIEDAGFEIRDVITWLYGSGFPKSLDVSKAIDKQAGAERTETFIREDFAKRSNKTEQRKSQVICGEKGIYTKPSTDAAKEWEGWGTALKPSAEFWTLARKPLSEKTVAENVLKWGTGAINVDGCRVKTNDKLQKLINNTIEKDLMGNMKGKSAKGRSIEFIDSGLGRFPANLILDEQAAFMLDAQSGNRPTGTVTPQNISRTHKSTYGKPTQNCNQESYGGGSGGASRFFYCAKASKSERNAGLDASDLIWENEAWGKQGLSLLAENILQLAKDTSDDTSTENKQWSTDLYGHSISEQYPKGMIYTIETVLKLITELKTLSASQSSNTKDFIQDAIRMIEANGLSLVESVEFSKKLSLNTIREKTESLLGVALAVLPMLLQIKGYAKSGNFHSTVKPLKLMQYLCRLITPPKGIVLDPFMGSGSTGVAAQNEGFDFIGIEREKEYKEIAEKRIKAASNGNQNRM